MTLSKLITFAQFDRIMAQLGFDKTVLPDRKGAVYKHAPTKTIFPVRPHKPSDYVPDYYLAGARSQFDGRGIIDAEEFEEMLRAAAAA